MPGHVIIGSGSNGLVVGALLALKGDGEPLLECSPHPGGYLRTEEITLPGFHHDAMAATFVLFMTGPAGADLGPHLARHGFDYCHSKQPTAVLGPARSSLVLTVDRAINISTCDALAAGDGDQLARDDGGIKAGAPRTIKGDAASDITATTRDDTREVFADRVKPLLARHIKDFASIKLARRAYSPADLAALTFNQVGGDPHGGHCAIDPFSIWRAPATAPIRSLAQVGTLTHPGPGPGPGPGLAGGSGDLAAKRLGA